MGERDKCGNMERIYFSGSSEVLFEKELRGGATRFKEHLARKSENVARCTKYPSDIWNYFLRELQKV
jgi:hypothetical protein